MFQALLHNFMPMKSIKAILPLIVALALLASCKTKNNIDLGKKPVMTFKEGTGYVAKSDTVKMNELVKVGVDIDNNGAADPLNKFFVLRVNAENDYTMVKEVDIPDDKGYSYSEDVKFTFPSTGKRTYKFIVNNTHGVETEKYITFTVVE